MYTSCSFRNKRQHLLRMAWKHNLTEYKRKKDEQQRRQQIIHGLRPFLVCFTDNATHKKHYTHFSRNSPEVRNGTLSYWYMFCTLKRLCTCMHTLYIILPLYVHDGLHSRLSHVHEERRICLFFHITVRLSLYTRQTGHTVLLWCSSTGFRCIICSTVCCSLPHEHCGNKESLNCTNTVNMWTLSVLLRTLNMVTCIRVVLCLVTYGSTMYVCLSLHLLRSEVSLYHL